MYIQYCVLYGPLQICGSVMSPFLTSFTHVRHFFCKNLLKHCSNLLHIHLISKRKCIYYKSYEVLHLSLQFYKYKVKEDKFMKQIRTIKAYYSNPIVTFFGLQHYTHAWQTRIQFSAPNTHTHTHTHAHTHTCYDIHL